MERKFIQHCKDDNLEEVTECLSRGVDVKQGMKKVAAPAATLPARKQAFMFFGR